MEGRDTYRSTMFQWRATYLYPTAFYGFFLKKGRHKLRIVRVVEGFNMTKIYFLKLSITTS